MIFGIFSQRILIRILRDFRPKDHAPDLEGFSSTKKAPTKDANSATRSTDAAPDNL